MATAYGFGALGGLMKKRAARLRPAFKAATTEATRALWVAARKRMNAEIYGIAEERSSTGKKQWTRTGNLRRSEKKRVLTPYDGVLVNDAKAKKGGTGYAHARHNLGLSGADKHTIPPPPSRKRNTERIAPWRAEAIEDTDKQRRDIYRRHILAALRLGP